MSKTEAIKSKREKVIENIAQSIYVDWNKDSRFTWKELPHYRKTAYLDWVKDIIFSQVEVKQHD